MNAMAGSGELNDDAQMWLAGHALNCYEGSARLRSWLQTPGLLTERIRNSAGSSYRMTVLAEQTTGADHVREVEMACGDVLWMFARSLVPAATLAQHPWLAHIGGTSLGEALAQHPSTVERSDFSYARLTPQFELVARALDRARVSHDALWIRRSTFSIDGAPLHLREVFLPEIGGNGGGGGG